DDRGGGNRILPEREDCTLEAWYRSLYAPRAGGAYDSHHRTAGIAGRTRRRSGRIAARGARAAAGDAGDWVPQWWDGGGVRTHGGRVPPGPQRSWLCRGPQRSDRVSLGGRSL